MADAPQVPVWHPELGDALPGARVIVRAIAHHKDGRVEDAQFWGVVKSAQKGVGIEIALEGSRKGETYWVPPDHRSIRKAKPGKYKLAPSGDEVENPDFILVWTVRKGVVKRPDVPLGGAPTEGG